MSSDPTGRADRSAAQSGAWIFVAGPSGAGKDTLMALACRELRDSASVQIARRVVTRARNDFEDHATVSDAEFRSLRDAGHLALWWQAHGLYYGIERRWQEAVDSGTIVLANVSRTVLGNVRQMGRTVRIVVVTAPDDVLAKRVIARGRDSAVSERLARTPAAAAHWTPDLVIENTGTPEQGAAALIALLRAVNDGQGAMADC